MNIPSLKGIAITLVIASMSLLVGYAHAKGKYKEQTKPSRASELFIQALRNSNYEMMDSFLKQGADINCQNCDSQRQTPLMISKNYQDTNNSPSKLVRYLVKNGADLNRKDRSGATALDIYVQMINPYWSGDETALFLLESGANPSIGDGNGSAAMHYFASVAIIPSQGVDEEYKQYSRRMIKALTDALLQHNADINQQNYAGDTPLHVAASKCGAFATALFLERGANTDLKNKAGSSALSLAEEKAAMTGPESPCNETVKILRNR